MREKEYWLAFALCYGIGPGKFDALLTYFGSAEKAWLAEEKELQKSGIGNAATAKIIAFKKEFHFERELERLQKAAADCITLEDAAYPKLLKKIDRPPFLLFYKGDIGVLTHFREENFMAVVGTRKVTDYGKLVTETITTDLANAGFVIVSGLALGVDAIAHAAALDAHGNTIAVLGSGVDYCTPRENQAIYDRILASGGLIISEVPLGVMPNKGSFPSRNRIIAGMSVGVLVTEGAEDSGSLITASIAEKLNRQVFAVPGPITSSVSKGANLLITRGATMVSSAKDILRTLGKNVAYSGAAKVKITADTKEEQLIIDLLSDHELHFDELVKKTGFPAAQLGTTLSLMEMKGYLTSPTTGTYVLANAVVDSD